MDGKGNGEGYGKEDGGAFIGGKEPDAPANVAAVFCHGKVVITFRIDAGE